MLEVAPPAGCDSVQLPPETMAHLDAPSPAPAPACLLWLHLVWVRTVGEVVLVIIPSDEQADAVMAERLLPQDVTTEVRELRHERHCRVVVA